MEITVKEIPLFLQVQKYIKTNNLTLILKFTINFCPVIRDRSGKHGSFSTRLKRKWRRKNDVNGMGFVIRPAIGLSREKLIRNISPK